MSRADFIDYYENHHSRLIRELQPQILDYRRNFINLDEGFISTTGHEPDFDVITEMWYESRASYEEAMAVWNDPALTGRRVNDERQFLDMNKITFFIAEEHS
jgi:hypothetical protein